jgi:hypothetical protein
LPYDPLPPPPSPRLSKTERMVHNQQIRAQLRMLGDPPPSSGHPMLLWICLNRYVKRGAKGTGLTLFFAHANGFPKEVRRIFLHCSESVLKMTIIKTWEPALHSVLNSPSGELVDEIWSWEAVQHGDSALLNGDSLGCLCM